MKWTKLSRRGRSGGCSTKRGGKRCGGGERKREEERGGVGEKAEEAELKLRRRRRDREGWKLTLVL